MLFLIKKSNRETHTFSRNRSRLKSPPHHYTKKNSCGGLRVCMSDLLAVAAYSSVKYTFIYGMIKYYSLREE